MKKTLTRSMENINKATAKRNNARKNANNAARKARLTRIEAQAIASEALGFASKATQEALVALNQLKIRCAEEIAEAEQNVRDTIEDERKTEIIVRNLFREENAQLKKIVTGKNSNNKNNKNNNNNNGKR